jgi:hypothetical protein
MIRSSFMGMQEDDCPAFAHSRILRCLRVQDPTLGKGEEGIRQLLAVDHVYYNFCLPHSRLRQALPQPGLTKGMGSATQWRPYTPAMAAGLTDHVWPLREVLLFRVPPWPQPVGV